jgi:hypothetical protein
VAVGLASFLASCGSGTDSDRDERSKPNEMSTERQEFVSRTPGAKHYPQPPRDPSASWTGIDNKIAIVDQRTGDMLLSQTADRERRILYFAYVTKDRELVRVFMTQWGGGSDATSWKTFPIRVWNIEEASKVTPAVAEARERATIERFAQLLSSWPDFQEGETRFVVIDAPVSEIDPL